MVEMVGSNNYFNESWVKLTICDNCKIVGLSDPCHECGGKIRKAMGRWVWDSIPPWYKFWEEGKGHWEIKQ